jgi:hypothetical protein
MATQRGYYRAELMRAIENITMALTHLARVVDAYAKDYPEISKYTQNMGDGLVLIAENIQKLHDAI